MICGVPYDPRVAWDLVDAGDLDRLFSVVTIEDMARSWINVQHRDESHYDVQDDDPDWWALELWRSEAWWAVENLDRVRIALLALVETAETDHDLGMIGAAL